MPMSLESLLVSERAQSVRSNFFASRWRCACLRSCGGRRRTRGSRHPATQPTTVSKARRAPHARTATATQTVRKSRRPSRYSKARAARARALWLEAQSPRYKLDDTGTMVPDIRAAAAIIYNPDTGQVLWKRTRRTSDRSPASRRS